MFYMVHDTEFVQSDFELKLDNVLETVGRDFNVFCSISNWDNSLEHNNVDTVDLIELFSINS